MENLDLVRDWKENMEQRHVIFQRFEKIFAEEKKRKEKVDDKGRRALKRMKEKVKEREGNGKKVTVTETETM